MYKIYADNVPIYDDTSADPYVKVASPKLTLELGAAGSLKLTIPPGNAGYSAIALMSTTLTVEKDDVEIWEGRVLQEEQDFWNQRILTCEGALAYLNDTAQGQTTIRKTGGDAASMALSDLIAVHNLHAPSERQFTVGEVYNASTEIDFTTDFESTMEAIMKYLVEAYGGYLRIRKIGGTRYIDWLADIRTDTSGLSKNTQKIEFGKNLMDFTGSFDLSTFATVILPLGKKKERPEGYDGPDEYTTVESVSPDNTEYVKAADEVYSAYGWIEKVIHWDDIDDPQTLYNTAVKYLTETQFDTMELSLSAFDLHYLNPKIEGVKLGDLLDVVSPPHGLDITLPVQKLEIPLDQPQNTIFQLGGEVKSGFTSSMSKINDEILQKLTETVDTDAILDAAKANTNAIMSQVLNGYVTLETDTTDGLHSEALYISDSKPILPKKDDGTYQAQRFWRWNMNGLGYTDDYGASWKTAITMDGSIIGERIAAGSIHGSKITAGTLDIVTSSGESGLSIGLTSRGMAPGSFMIGDIDQHGQNAYTTNRARSALKIYLTAGTKVTLNSTSYWFEPMEYSDNDDPESSFVNGYGEPYDRTFTVSSTNYYRFVVRKVNDEVINPSELNAIAAAFDLGGKTATFTATDFKFLGAVTFTDLENTASSTFINGANIKTGTIIADCINLYSGFTVFKKKEDGTLSTDKTFEIKSNGEVYVNGQVVLGSGTTISWAQVKSSDGSMTAEDIYNTATSAQSDADYAVDAADDANTNANSALSDVYKIAHGDYTDAGTAFISEKKIYSPTIYGGIIAAGMFTGLDVGTKAPSFNSGIRVANSIEFVNATDTTGDVEDKTYKTQGWIGCLTGHDQTKATTGVGLSSYGAESSGYGGKIVLTNAGSLFDYSESEMFGNAAGASILAHVAYSSGFRYGEIKFQTYEWDSGNGQSSSSELTFSNGRLATGLLVLGSGSYGTENNRLNQSAVAGQIYFQTN